MLNQVVVGLNLVCSPVLLAERYSFVDQSLRDLLLNRWYVAMSEPLDQVVVGLNLVCSPVLLTKRYSFVDQSLRDLLLNRRCAAIAKPLDHFVERGDPVHRVALLT